MAYRQGDPENVTRLLREWSAGDEGALEELVPLIYGTLRRLAAARLRQEKNAPTLQPTALVHEAYVRLAQQHTPDWESRAQFYGIAVRLMRQVLVDHARERQAGKRGGGAIKLDIDQALGVAAQSSGGPDILALNQALESLERHEPFQARVVLLRYFAGLTNEQAAAALSVSPATVKKEWAYARAWLKREIDSGHKPGAPSEPPGDVP